MKGTLLKDINGNVSSKRVAGYILLGVSIVGGFVGAFINNAMLVDYCKWLAVTGALPLVVTIAERRS